MNNTVTNYINHLYDETTDGYIQLMKLVDGRAVAIKNYKNNTVKTVIGEYIGHSNVYITPNTTYNGKRLSSNIRQLRALYIDIDNRELEFTQLVYDVWILANEGEIPYPTMIVRTGGGIHVYWRIENAPYQALGTWQELEDYFYYKLKHLGADRKALDSVRVLRVPETLNTKYNTCCEIVLIKEITYSMYDLREKYLNWKPKEYQLQLHQTRKERIIKNAFFNSYSLHITRLEDVKMLVKLREYNVTGYRNFILHCYAYWLGVTVRDDEQLANEVIEFNNSFNEPLRLTEVNAILRCIPKAIAKFISYEQGIRSGEIKRVSKGMKDKGGYWYKNETLIENLDMTVEEQKYMKTIIGKEIKYDRNNDRRRKARRNENGLTAKQQQIQELKEKVLQLKGQKLSNRTIAKQLNKSEGTIRNILKR